jgi:DUF1680 family protein
MSSRKKASKNGLATNRREVLKGLGSGALIAAGEVGARGSLATAAVPAVDYVAKPSAVQLQLQSFALADVRLLDGPFLDAQKLNEAYLLKLDADRMLHNFRVNAGLAAKAPVYGGWESVQTWADIRAHGHTLGHFLSGASMQYAASGHEEIRRRVEYILTELKDCQDSAGSGLICAFPDDSAQIDNMVAGRRTIGVPWYTLHKIYSGLRDAHLLLNSALARDILVRFTDWAVDVTKDMTDEQFQRMLATEHGGMNEVIADVYVLTGDERHLALAERFCHNSVLVPLSERRDTLNGLHSNTQIPKIVGFERLFHLTGKKDYHAAAEFFWKTVTGTRSYATGGNGEGEHFFPVTEFLQRLASAKTMETCCSHNMLRLTRLLFEHNPTATYGDYYERALYNTILASQCPDTGMVTYFQSTRPGYIKLFCTPFDSFWCCTGTGIENHAKYGDSIYFRGAANGEQRDSLYINLFIASNLNWKEKGFSVKQTTSFPEAGKTRLEITVTKPVELSLKIRHPSWAATAMVRLNGASAQLSRQPGTFISLRRTWKSGDVVEVDMPMAMRREVLPGTTDTVAAVYGPIVLVGALGNEVKPGEDLHVNERTIGTVHNQPIEVPSLVGAFADLPSRIKPTGAPLTFKTDGIGKPAEVTLIPYYKMAHQHYNMYWKVQDA